MTSLSRPGSAGPAPASSAPAEPGPDTSAQTSWATPFPDVSPELLERLTATGPRYTSYPTAPEWTAAFGPADYAEALARAAHDPAPLSLYVHVPFCREMCAYCGCHVVVTRSAARMDRYLDAIATELALVGRHLGSRRRLSRIHVGGGTPTSLDERQLWRLWDAVTRVFSPTEDAEIAVEIDPVVTRPAQLATLRTFGFRRVSMGVQDFDPEVQRAVNRVQTVEETEALVRCARELGYVSVNLDLIYGLPFQTPASWERTLERVLALGPDRIAVFSFAYVPSVKPHQRRLPVHGLPSPAAKLELFRRAHRAFTSAGYRWIGMDHFARPDDELALAEARGTLWRDFQGYTARGDLETVAIGVSGIGLAGGAYAQNVKSLRHHAEAVAAGRLPVERGHRMSEDDVVRRRVITELMCNFRVDLGPEGARRFANEIERLRPLEQDGLVALEGDRVRVTALGRPFVRHVAMAFDAYLHRPRRGERPTFSATI